MRVIDLDAKEWHTPLDFAKALLRGIDAPNWHGNSVAALMEGMVWGGTGTIDPPYVVRISGLDHAPSEVVEEVKLVRDCLMEARQEFQTRNGRDVDVTMEIMS